MKEKRQVQKSIKQLFKKYQVKDCKSLQNFCKKYYKFDRFENRGISYMKAVIESHKESLKIDGITFISHHDSCTGQAVSYIENKKEVKV